ncbi:MAG: 30S ribosomal protein S5 [Candidatus Pacebacteria bacterium CG10_big_fil_rev_8_21_14_0_10_56_10]|nr:MAG: 30S ribosomal protein S5 [Candidatus Pacebacteria bacterium CG10_big_fil_rev_8_21_14_0_10_56_10]
MPAYITPTTQSEFDEKVIQISRVSKKTKGGNKIGFSALMVVGDKKGQVGVGLGKAGDVVTAIRKGVKKAKKQMITFPMDGTTIPFAIETKLGAGRVLLKPAPQGSGVIAGGPVRAVVEAVGIRDISSKILGSDNQASSVYATFEALRAITRLVKIRGLKLRSIAQIEAEEAQRMKELQSKAKSKDDTQPSRPDRGRSKSKPGLQSSPVKAGQVKPGQARPASAPGGEPKPASAPDSKTKTAKVADNKTKTS